MNVKKACSMGERFHFFPIKLLSKIDIEMAKFNILRIGSKLYKIESLLAETYRSFIILGL